MGGSPQFATILAEFRLKMLQSSRDALQATVPYAIWTLMDIMTNGKSEFVREKAANDILAHTKIMDQPSSGAPGEEQAELLKKIMEKADSPRTQVQVLIVGGQFQLREVPLNEPTKLIEAPGEGDRGADTP
jgi:hypothetical protein